MSLVSCEAEDGVATVRMDDGKVNALSSEMLAGLFAALDGAESAGAAVVLTGREGVFSAGFSLPVLQSGGEQASAMVRAGFALAERLLTFPAPVTAACTGHAIAMGAFLLLSADYRLGATGPFKLMANEVQIGFPMPYAAIEICRQRLSPPHFQRVVTLSDAYSPEDAVGAGFLDRVVPPADLAAEAAAVASRLGALPRSAYRATKERALAGALGALRQALEADFGSDTGVSRR